MLEEWSSRLLRDAREKNGGCGRRRIMPIGLGFDDIRAWTICKWPIDRGRAMSVRAYELTKVETPSDWGVYHAIRREVLFEARGNLNYDPDHSDERNPENLPLLLRADGVALGAVRLDLRPDYIAIVRLVAIRTENQRAGHGTTLLERLEIIARGLGITELRVYAAADAVEFYCKNGFENFMFDPDNRQSNVLLQKILRPTEAAAAD
jgi:N-acetylglutamate synthase-like GNAT family acetyltransferase